MAILKSFQRSVLVSLFLVAPVMAQDIAKGVVYNDLNRNLVRDFNEHGIKGVSVSNGLDVVQTDEQGRYRLPVDDETVIFITKPRGFQVPVNDVQLPQFYYIHYPNGTPPVADFLFPVIEPTGSLPESVDFALFSDEPKNQVSDYEPSESRFHALAFADPQAGNFSQRLDPLLPDDFGNRQLSDLRDEFIQGLVGTPAKFVMVAGDIVNDNLDLYPRHNRIMSALGIPVWNALGNHDINFKSPNDKYSNQTFIRTFGPTDYSFDYGDVHFIAMDNVFFKGNSDPFDEGLGTPESFEPGLPDGGTLYRGEFTRKQLQWLANDLRFVPEDKLVVLYTHIPLKTLAISSAGTVGAGNINTVNLAKLLKVLEGREHVYSFSGHDTSNSWLVLLGDKEGRSANLPPIPHKTLAEVRTSLPGPFDDRGVRVSNLEDGNPEGYYFMAFNDNEIKTRFEAAVSSINTPTKRLKKARKDEYQMRISVAVSLNRDAIEDLDVTCPAPDFEPVGDPNYVVANVFDGSELHEVSMSLNDGPFEPMEHLVRQEDVETLPDGILRPRGTAWCLDPFMVRFNQRITDFLVDIEANTETSQAQRFTIPTPDPSGHLWAATVPTDLEPGVHVLKVRSTDEFGNTTEANKVFEVCEEGFDTIENGQVELRDCVILSAQ